MSVKVTITQPVAKPLKTLRNTPILKPVVVKNPEGNLRVAIRIPADKGYSHIFFAPDGDFTWSGDTYSDEYIVQEDMTATVSFEVK